MLEADVAFEVVKDERGEPDEFERFARHVGLKEIKESWMSNQATSDYLNSGTVLPPTAREAILKNVKTGLLDRVKWAVWLRRQMHHLFLLLRQHQPP